MLGTGIMGAGMARSLLREGHDVRVWNRNRDRAQPLAGDGATVAQTPAEAVHRADVVITMLYDTAAVVDVVEQAAASFGPHTVWVQSATIGLSGMRAAAELASSRQLRLLDAPVLGTKGPAEQGKLVVLASGDPSLRSTAQPAFDAIGSRTVWAGDQLGQGSALKLACNAWVATMTAATAQSLALAAGLGLDANLFLQAIEGGSSDSPYAHVKGELMLQGRFPTSFALDGVRKDLELIRQAAVSAKVNPAVADAVSGVFAQAAAAGHGDEDMSAVYTAFTPG